MANRVLLAVAAACVLALASLLLTAPHETDPAPHHPASFTSDAADIPLAAPHYPVPRGALFVATDGDDSAAGTKADPLRTVAAAVERVPDGGTVVLRKGTYRETIGAVRKRITIQPYNGERVWLKGSVVVSGWTRHGDVWRHEGWDVRLCHSCYDKRIIDPRYPYAGYPDMVFVDGKPLRQVGSAADVATGTFFVDRAHHRLVLGDDPTGKVVEAAAFDRLLQFDPGSEGSVIRGIGIAEYASNQDYGHHGAMVVVNARNVTLADDTFAWSASSGAAVFKPDADVDGNIFVDNGLVGLVANRADDVRLTRNRFVRNNQEHFALTGNAIGAAGAKLTRTKRPYVADNIFKDNIGTGWWCDLGCTDATVVRNRAVGNVVNGLYYEVSARALIASNVSVGNRARGLKISSSDHVRVYNNTLYHNGVQLGIYNDPRSPSTDPYSESIGLSWATSHTVLVNNLLVEPRPGNALVRAHDGKQNPPPQRFVAVSDGNGYLRSKGGSAVLIEWSTGHGQVATFDSLTDFRDATGQGAHSLRADFDKGNPPFRDPAHGDYRLRTWSPGVSGGLPLPDDVAKAIGVPATQHPDIGVLLGPRQRAGAPSG